MRRSYDPSKRITKKGSKKGILLGGGPIYNDWKTKVSTAEFLKKYREYESLLLEHGSNYKQAEDSASGITQKRMRICRQLRNYLVHQEDSGFIQISKKQIHFLQNLIYNEKEKSYTIIGRGLEQKEF